MSVGFVCGVSLLPLGFRHTHTHTHSGGSLVAVRSSRGAQTAKARHTGALLHKQTNQHTCCSWQVALTISLRREGKQNKQFNLHDSSLLCISSDRGKLCWKEPLVKSDGPVSRCTVNTVS